MDKTICILVLYKPTDSLLKQVVESIINQVEIIWISDNTPGGYNKISEITSKYSDLVVYSKMNGNVGIAKAQNEGIRYAIENNFDYIFFLDQDSISPAGIVNSLVEGYELIAGKGIKIGGIGPLPINRVTGKDYPVDIIGYLQIPDNIIVEARDLMNSASLINVRLFCEVGMMDESLFIDGVDHELCWRAYAKGYRFFINRNISLSHKLGEGDQRLFGKSIKIPTPFRTYYQYRNYFWLLRRKYVPLSWKVLNGIKYICKYFYYPIFCKSGSMYLKNMNRGIVDGICKKNRRPIFNGMLK